MTAPDDDGRRALGGETPIGEVVPGKVPGREPVRPPLPKRFYKIAEAAIDGAPPYGVRLDGRPVRTPKKHALAVPVAALAEAIAAEWARQGAQIDPATMPLTRLANTTLDGVVGNEDALRADIAAYAMSDLVCYRAEGPAELALRQSEQWDPVLGWVEQRFGCRFALAAGVMPVPQPEASRRTVHAALATYDAFQLSALHVVTTLTGSALLALALVEQQLDADAVWAAAHVDEDHQVAQWGEDSEARARRAMRREEMNAAARWLEFVGRS